MYIICSELQLFECESRGAKVLPNRFVLFSPQQAARIVRTGSRTVAERFDELLDGRIWQTRTVEMFIHCSRWYACPAWVSGKCPARGVATRREVSENASAYVTKATAVF